LKKGGFLVRFFVAEHGTLIEASIMKSQGAWRWRMAKTGESCGFAFGKVCAYAKDAGSELTQTAKLFGLTETTAPEEISNDVQR